MNAALGLLSTTSILATKLGTAERNMVSQEKVTKEKPVMRSGAEASKGSLQSIGAMNWDEARAETFSSWSGACKQ